MYGTDTLDVAGTTQMVLVADVMDSSAVGASSVTYVGYGLWDGVDTFTLAAAFDGTTGHDAIVVQGDNVTTLNSGGNSGWGSCSVSAMPCG